MSDYLRHLFLPHHTNNFRAKLLHADVFALYVIGFFALSMMFKTVHMINPDLLGFATNITVDTLVELTNKKRAEQGLASLKYNPQLSQAAAGKAADMFNKDYWAHVAPDGVTPWDFIKGTGYTYSVAGENLAKNFTDSSGVVEAWMNSPTHRENLLRDQYEEVGFAVVNGKLGGEETTLVVQMFGKPLHKTSKSTAEKSTSPLEISETPAQAVVGQMILASPLPTPITQALSNKQPNSVGDLAGAVIKSPLIDMGRLAKLLTLALSSVLMLTLIIDGWFVWHKKVVRVGGKNIAHLVFLFAINSTVWFMSVGSII